MKTIVAEKERAIAEKDRAIAEMIGAMDAFKTENQALKGEIGFR